MVQLDRMKTEQVLRDLESSDATLHSRAASLLGSVLPESALAVDLLVKALASPDFRVVFWCLIALKRLQVQPSREIVERLAQSHPICGVREAALDYLVCVLPSDGQLRAVLIAALRDPEKSVRATAMRAILSVPGWTGDEKAKVLESGAHDASWMWRGITARFQGG